jgi:hypothetical protein
MIRAVRGAIRAVPRWGRGRGPGCIRRYVTDRLFIRPASSSCSNSLSSGKNAAPPDLTGQTTARTARSRCGSTGSTRKGRVDSNLASAPRDRPVTCNPPKEKECSATPLPPCGLPPSRPRGASSPRSAARHSMRAAAARRSRSPLTLFSRTGSSRRSTARAAKPRQWP